MLQLAIRHSAEKPDVILLQETRTDDTALSGYNFHASHPSGKLGISILISKRLTFVPHDFGPEPKLSEHLLIELIPGGRLKENIFVLNVYSPPRDSQRQFRQLFSKAAKLARSSPLVIGGDFNAPHHAWGYPRSTAKGNHLWQTINEFHLTLLTDPAFPTRIGNSVTRDTTPDLTLTLNIQGAVWQNLNEGFGSDHNLIGIQFHPEIKPLRAFCVTNWDKFRKIRADREASATEGDNLTLEEWTKQLQEDEKATTEVVETDLAIESMDSHLAHLLTAKQSILKRWKTQRHNRKLRKKVAELNRSIEDYCHKLSMQHWDELCNSMEGQMRIGGKWNLLKHLLNESNTRSGQSSLLNKALYTARKSLSDSDIVTQLSQTYLPLGPTLDSDYPSYSGLPQDGLERDFAPWEIRDVLYKLKTKSAPGLDGVTNKCLKNLDDKSIDLLTEEINRIWKNGDIPQAWKHAKVVLIPKPGRSPDLSNLRPISLTSTLCKVMEHAILNRYSRYIETQNLLPYQMVGFRPALSTQDAMRLIHHQIINVKSRDVRGILGLDLEKAFDNIRHAHILHSISEMGLGARFHAFVSSFLRNRQATLHVGDIRSEPQELGPRGTPQGAVLSPLLFNIALSKLSTSLAQIPGINHTIYADDITIWTTGGRDSDCEEHLQSALDTTERFLEGTGLRCSPKKSELLLYQPTLKGRRPKGWTPPAEATISLHGQNGSPIPQVAVIRILGMFVEANGNNSHTIDHLTSKTETMTRLLNRVSNRRGGIREDNLVRLFQAFLMSHITYVAAMHNWSQRDKTRLNTLIRGCIKRVLGVPTSTSTERLLQLGMHNTLEEIIEAQSTAQLARLSSTRAGRNILDTLGLNPSFSQTPCHQLPPHISSKLRVAPMPRNMHPQYNAERRAARAKSILTRLRDDPHSACFVDAAQYDNSKNFVAVTVDQSGSVRSSLSIPHASADCAEQVAIAHALLDSTHSRIYSDSRAALRAFSSGWVVHEAYRLLRDRDISPHSIIWFPAHTEAGLDSVTNLNEVAHSHARALTLRAGSDTSSPAPEAVLDFRDALLTFNDVTKHFKLGRRAFPPPQRKLSRAQEITLRLLQTQSYPNLALYHHIDPESFPNTCPECGLYGSLSHMLWQCPALTQTTATAFNSQEDWDAALRSQDALVQIRAVQRAHDLAERLGLPVPTWERPAVLRTS